MGLSPLVRGKRLRGIARSIVSGSIPACAGETCRSPDPNTNQRVYPRLCGGNGAVCAACPGGRGLSPLVRGKPSRGDIWANCPGSIPACAGETACLFWVDHSGRVYPRLCGGNSLQIAPPCSATGLSPLVRGKRAAYSVRSVPGGSIPACAGETLVFNIMIC